MGKNFLSYLTIRLWSRIIYVCFNNRMLTVFIAKLFETYMDLHFTYLEVNPLVVTDSQIFILDLASKIDQTADYLCKTKWGGEIEFPPPFGRDAYPEVLI